MSALADFTSGATFNPDNWSAPAATNVAGRVYTVKNTGTGTITLTTSGAQAA